MDWRQDSKRERRRRIWDQDLNHMVRLEPDSLEPHYVIMGRLLLKYLCQKEKTSL